MKDSTKDTITGLSFLLGVVVAIATVGWFAIRQFESVNLDEQRQQRLKDIERVLDEHRKARQQNEDQ